MNTRLNPESIMFVGTQGLFRVVTPFDVVVVRPIDMFIVGDCVKVYRVIAGSEDELLYYITKKYYSHHNFYYIN